MKTLGVALFSLLFAVSAQAWDAKTEFKTNCAVCHSVGGGDKTGPDLAGLHERRKEKWIIKFIKYPTGMMEGDEEEEGYEKADPIAAKLWEKYKPAVMADQELSDDQIKKLIAHIKELSKGKKAKGKILEVK